ncbi:MAG: YdcF family protein [Methylococcaceae bacterium]|nr:YdcF family protein [Prolixibacteraceae bacterium]
MAKMNLIDRLWKVMRSILAALGIIFLILLIISFTTWPFWGYYWLGTSKSRISGKPDYIILLGGGGMPSESNLMRAFFVFKAATDAPDSKIIISIPGDISDPNSTARLVAAELVSKGIDSMRIDYEQIGTNTRSQALQLQQFHSDRLMDKSILLVSSPEHMRRAVLVFQKAGFKNINALPAFENALEANLYFKDEDLGGNKLPIPDIGNHTSVRYQFWNHLKYEILIAREMAALGYYKLRGWI